MSMRLTVNMSLKVSNFALNGGGLDLLFRGPFRLFLTAFSGCLRSALDPIDLNLLVLDTIWSSHNVVFGMPGFY